MLKYEKELGKNVEIISLGTYFWNFFFTFLDDTFLISQTTGRIYLRRPVDFESTQKSYYITVEASDGEFSSTALINVTVTDVNDNVPICTPTEYNVTIDEDRSVGSTVMFSLLICFSKGM